MGIRFVDLEGAKAASGLRLVLAVNVPSPWSEAVRALVAAKKLDAVAVPLTLTDVEVRRWSGVPNAPAVLWESELARSGWAEILSLLERLTPGHVPAEQRVELFGLSHELMGERGLAWCRRALLVAQGIATEGREGLPLQASRALVTRYGHATGEVSWARERSVSLLREFDRRLDGKEFFYRHLSALDVYCAAVVNSLEPLPQEARSLAPQARAIFSWADPAVAAAITAELRAHRDRLAPLFRIEGV